MGQLLLVLVVGLVVGAVVFGVSVLLTGGDPGLAPAEPDGRAIPLPTNRPLAEEDVSAVRFDVAARGYRMTQVDRALQRAAYDIGYKDELINVLEAEVAALREGRAEDAEVLRRAREAALAGTERAGDPELPAAGAVPPRDAVVDLGLVSAGTAAAFVDVGAPEPGEATVETPEPGELALDTSQVDEPASDEPDLRELELDEAEPGEPETDEAPPTETGVYTSVDVRGAEDVAAEAAEAAEAVEPIEATEPGDQAEADEAAEPVDPAADDAMSGRR